MSVVYLGIIHFSDYLEIKTARLEYNLLLVQELYLVDHIPYDIVVFIWLNQVACYMEKIET